MKSDGKETSMGQAQAVINIFKNKVRQKIIDLHKKGQLRMSFNHRQTASLWNVVPWMVNFVPTHSLWSEIMAGGES